MQEEYKTFEARINMQEEYRTFEARIKTFDNWSSDFPKRALAKAGFIYTGKDDIVYCPSCEVEGFNWLKTDDPFADHLKWRPDCKYVTQVLFNVKRKFPRYVDKTTFQKRLDTFKDWPVGLAQKPEELADAGFFYSGYGDNVICFHCGYGFRNWIPTSDVWEEHSRYKDTCEFINVKLNKCSITLKGKKDNDICTSTCIICLKSDKCIVFLPCRHFVSCVDCAFSVTNCFICRDSVESFLKIFVS